VTSFTHKLMGGQGFQHLTNRPIIFKIIVRILMTYNIMEWRINIHLVERQVHATLKHCWPLGL
jgi:hypothetical protein